MSARLLALGIAVAALAIWLTRPASVTAPEVAIADEAEPSSEPRAPAAAATTQRRLARDPFRYEEAASRVPEHPVSTIEPVQPQAPPAPATPEPVRLSGFVRQGGQLKAVLSVYGTTVLAGAGEAAEGYRVIAVDEDAGVRVRAPSGEELLLRPAAR
jgi:hypothetical protein